MDLIGNIALGFSVALTLQNILYCFIGVLLGTLVGVLPGLGPVATIAILLPVTFGLEPTTALIMLSGIYYGAQYGGSTTAILVNLPGETGSIVTAIDGYQMARRGRAAQALIVAALGSFFAGTVATLVIAAFGPVLSRIGLAFGPAEYFSLMLLGLAAAIVLAHGSIIKALCMTMLGLILSFVGTDYTTGALRFTFGIPRLADGIDFLIIAMALFGISEVIMALGRSGNEGTPSINKLGRWTLSREDFRRSWGAVLRGTGIGSVLGILPGGGAILGSFASYVVEKRLSKNPSEFGNGAIEGVAGPESANNAGAQTSFIPLLTLGLPSNAVTALMVGALIIHNVKPGPQIIVDNPDLFWGLIASMWIGNLLLVILNLPLIGIWVALLRVRYSLIYPAIILLCCVGIYGIARSAFGLLLLAGLSALGFLLKRLNYEPAPLLLAFVLGTMMEENFRRTLLLSGGDMQVFVTRPISLTLILCAIALFGMTLVPAFARRRATTFASDET